MEQSGSDSRVIKPGMWIPAAVLALLVAAASIGLGMKAMSASGASIPAASVLFQPTIYTTTIAWDLSFPIQFITNTGTGMFLDIEARLEDDTVLDTQVIGLGKIPLEHDTVITVTNWVWEGTYLEGAYQAVRMRVVIPEEVYLIFSPTTALDDSGLVYDGYFIQDAFFVGEFYGRLTGATGPSDDRGFWYYDLLPTANGTPEPTNTPGSPTSTPSSPTTTPTSTPWHDDCPPAPLCSPTPDQPTLTPRSPWPTLPIPTCRPVETCPPWPTPLPTATDRPTLTPWPTQPGV